MVKLGLTNLTTILTGYSYHIKKRLVIFSAPLIRISPDIEYDAYHY